MNVLHKSCTLHTTPIFFKLLICPLKESLPIPWTRKTNYKDFPTMLHDTKLVPCKAIALLGMWFNKDILNLCRNNTRYNIINVLFPFQKKQTLKCVLLNSVFKWSHSSSATKMHNDATCILVVLYPKHTLILNFSAYNQIKMLDFM